MLRREVVTHSAGAPHAASFAPATRLLVGFAFLLAYVALERLSFLHEYQGLPITPWNPGLGMMVALIMLAGPAAGGVLFAGVVVSEVFVADSRLPWPIILAIGAIVSVGFVAAIALAERYLELDPRLNRLRDILALFAAGAGAALVVAAILAALLVATGHLGRQEALSAATPLIVGDIIGIAVMTPLVLTLARRHPEFSVRRLVARLPDMLLFAALVAAVLRVILAGGAADGPKYFYLFFLPVVAAAVRHGLDGACLGLAATQFALVWVLHAYGFDARAFTEFQTLMIVLTGAGLIVGVAVSERRNADRRARLAEAKLREKETEAAEAARLALVSSMASAIAHEISQPMTAARALGRSAQHLLRAPGGDLARADANLTSMVAQIDHAGEVVRRMREFLRRGRPHVSAIDVKSMLEDALSLVRANGLAKRVLIELNVADGLSPIHGDRVQLQQVVLNLVTNAMEALAERDAGEKRVRVAAWLDDDRAQLVISVADNGPGVDRSLGERLFEPLLTSKEQGLGLGLAICASIIEAHGGRIWLEPAAAEGAEFRFSLPIERPD